MPKSKNRHKGSGKVVKKKPGRRPNILRDSPDTLAYGRFSALYREPFYEQWRGTEPYHAGYMLDFIIDAAFDDWPTITNPVSKRAIFEEFVEPVDESELLTEETAEAALAFLAEQGMVTVEGDEITIPEKFIPKEG